MSVGEGVVVSRMAVVSRPVGRGAVGGCCLIGASLRSGVDRFWVGVKRAWHFHTR